MQAGIKEDGYGLGVVAGDFNNDGWPDIYVANDFVSNDELWLNNHNGTFTNCIGRPCVTRVIPVWVRMPRILIMMHCLILLRWICCRNTMNEKKDLCFFMNHDRYDKERAMGYEPEFMRNMLQLNNGNIKHGDTSVPFFSEIGQLAGIQATDWSWSVLLADFDNDGWKDMHITNGIGRDFINADFLEFSSNVFNST